MWTCRSSKTVALVSESSFPLSARLHASFCYRYYIQSLADGPRMPCLLDQSRPLPRECKSANICIVISFGFGCLLRLSVEKDSIFQALWNFLIKHHGHITPHVNLPKYFEAFATLTALQYQLKDNLWDISRRKLNFVSRFV